MNKFRQSLLNFKFLQVLQIRKVEKSSCDIYEFSGSMIIQNQSILKSVIKMNFLRRRKNSVPTDNREHQNKHIDVSVET